MKDNIVERLTIIDHGLVAGQAADPELGVGGAAVEDLVDLHVKGRGGGQGLRIDRRVENGMELDRLSLRSQKLLGGDTQLRVVVDGDAQAIGQGKIRGGCGLGTD